MNSLECGAHFCYAPNRETYHEQTATVQSPLQWTGSLKCYPQDTKDSWVSQAWLSCLLLVSDTSVDLLNPLRKYLKQDDNFKKNA